MSYKGGGRRYPLDFVFSLFQVWGHLVEKMVNVLQLVRRQAHVNGPHSVGVTGDKANCIWHEGIDGNVDGA